MAPSSRVPHRLRQPAPARAGADGSACLPAGDRLYPAEGGLDPDDCPVSRRWSGGWRGGPAPTQIALGHRGHECDLLSRIRRLLRRGDEHTRRPRGT